LSRSQFRPVLKNKHFVMPARFAATATAFEKSIENTKPAAAIKLIEGWEEALSSVDIPGAKGIARDLEALKKALGADEPDGERVKTLLGKLAEAVTKIAGRTDGNVQTKIEELGKALAA
jgi:hypothetical protein